MGNSERFDLGDKRYREIVYATDDVLSTKIRVHELYSSVAIDLNAEICKLLDLTGEETILDIGCGTGDFLIHLRKSAGHRGKLCGGDISSGVFEKAKILSHKEDLDIDFFEGSILRLPFVSDQFDVVTALHMLSHVPLKEALEESKRVLSEKGKFLATANSLLSYPHIDKYRKIAFEMMGWGKPVFTTTSFNMENMQKELSRVWSGVEIKKLQGELRIPIHEFLKYFYANMLVWEPLPTEDESKVILDRVSERLEKDSEDGFIVEPKFAGIALCTQ